MRSQKDDIIKIEHLSKKFEEIKAVQDLSFCVKRGELFAFLGVNGAGKSTTISIICGQLIKDSGTVIIDDLNLDDNLDNIKRDIGVVFQSSFLDNALSVQDNLEIRAALYGITGQAAKDRIKELSTMLDFQGILKRTVSKLSGGQRRRVDIARALLHQPKILILDEPTTGLDPQTRKVLWDVIAKLRKEKNITIFLTTHYMEEASDADYVVIIDNGLIIAEGTPLELKNRYTHDFITLYGVTEKEVQTLKMSYETISAAYKITVPDTKAATELIIGHPEIFKDYEIIKGKMDDVFLNVTGKKLTGGEKE